MSNIQDLVIDHHITTVLVNIDQWQISQKSCYQLICALCLHTCWYGSLASKTVGENCRDQSRQRPLWTEP